MRSGMTCNETESHRQLMRLCQHSGLRQALSDNRSWRSSFKGRLSRSPYSGVQSHRKSYLMSQKARDVRAVPLQELCANRHFLRIMDVRAFSALFVALSKFCEKLAVLLLLGTPRSCIVQTPPNLLTGKSTTGSFWVSNKLIPVPNSQIAARQRQAVTTTRKIHELQNQDIINPEKKSHAM